MPCAHCVNACDVKRTPRVLQLEGLFDIPPTKRASQEWDVDLPLDDVNWNIGLIVGPSGCGKSTVARELFAGELVEGFDWPHDESVVDGFGPEMGIKDITHLLSSVGFSSPPAWLRPFRTLSNGEQFRATIARALAEKPDLAVIDEFSSVVDRQVAQIGSAAIAKSVRRRNQKFIAVSCHYDIVDWLCPDWIYEPVTGEFTRKEAGPSGGPFRRPPIRLTISRCHRTAWDIFRKHHYLDHTLSRAVRCFLATVEGRPAAFTAVCHFPHATHPAWREHRTVCLPDFQGVGIGNAMSDFVAAVLTGTGKRYISITSSPAMIYHRAKSPKWNMHRKPSLVAAPGAGEITQRSNSYSRITAGFKYVGQPADPETVRAFLS